MSNSVIFRLLWSINIHIGGLFCSFTKLASPLHVLNMSLPKAQLGRNGPQVNRLGFGLMGLSMFYGTPKPDEERLDILTQAHKLGERFWDSSDL